jgi:hypothetical protein
MLSKHIWIFEGSALDHVVDGWYIFPLNYLDLEFVGTDGPKYDSYSPGLLVWDHLIHPIVLYCTCNIYNLNF